MLKGKENAGYIIIDCVCANEEENWYYVLGKNAIGNYVTWFYNGNTDSFNHGHYITDYKNARVDFYERIIKEIDSNIIVMTNNDYENAMDKQYNDGYKDCMEEYGLEEEKENDYE